ncbi:glutamine amidotransferase [Zafaria sp. Z1313]|uniref:glutamine amidotransferase n=1 Tax=unclassified Zafaria TaxID=2828765 RepID=UPI002E7A25BB|nr:glutamine amidotransferase [Zafaria sp. J156]MEE1621845.1 glutamine amidotransferase [Zafaria sp. J156]
MTARPFLLLSTRSNATAAEDEVRGFLDQSGMDRRRLEVLRLGSGPGAVPVPDALQDGTALDAYAGILVGGSPFNSSDPHDHKDAAQREVEAGLGRLLDHVVEHDVPFLGACYGVGTLGTHQGAVVDRRFGEPVGTSAIELTDEGVSDPLTAGMPRRFTAFVGHKEAVSELPPHAVLLATSGPCPVQMFRIKKNLYATQFHPELDPAGLATRIAVYRDAGYFPPSDAERLTREALAADVPWPGVLLRNFVRIYADAAVPR